MKNILQSFICTFILITIVSAGVYAGTKSKSQTIVIQTSAVCESCKARIEKALKATDGILDANLNVSNSKIKVKYDANKLSENQIRLVITGTGYDADNMKKDETAYNKLPHCCQKAGGACKHE